MELKFTVHGEPKGKGRPKEARTELSLPMEKWL